MEPAVADETTLDGQLATLLSSTTSKDFSVATYLNLALKEAAETSAQSHGDELQQRMAELALQLQLQTQSCHEDIGRIGAELQAILPRCHADVGRVGVGLEGMKQDATALLEVTSQRKSANEQDVETSLETLSTLHALQSNLSRTEEILTAAATWDATLSSIAPLLAQQNLAEAVAALAKLESGERALRGMPHPEERHASITHVRQQVSVLLQPQLKHALQNMNTRLAPLQQCVGLYRKLGNMEALQQEYIKNRPMAVHKAWFAYTPSYETTTTSSDSNTNTNTNETFVSWLPEWYETVLNLLTEERRQALAVFGQELVSDMVVKVMAECFRPILPSFRSRLESLYSSNPTTSGSGSSGGGGGGGPSHNNNKGSLENIAKVYEATLQFLSVAYETVAGGYLDMLENHGNAGGSVSTTDTTAAKGIQLYKDLEKNFLQVASPFTPYQERLAALETKHATVTAQLIREDLQQATSAGAQDLTALQDATDRLKGLTAVCFPLVEDVLSRFELLNGGFHVQPSLAAMDGLLAGHARDMASAISSLRNSMTADETKLAEQFDDQHVLCALEVLKVAGLFRRHMSTFESKTQQRLKVLAERMTMQMKTEKQIADTLSGAAKTSSDGPFSLPESLSVVEIDSFLTKAVCGSGGESRDAEEDPDAATISTLEILASGSATGEDVQGPVILYSQVGEAIKALANTCHKFVYSVCSSVPRLHLSGISTMSAWKEDSGADDIASYGTLPQNYITHVGEHMLALVQALEPFASDSEALSLANEVMDGVRGVSLQSWQEFLASAGSRESTDDVVKTLMEGEEIVDLIIWAPVEEEEEEGEEDEATRASTAFCNAWLDVVGLSVTGRLLERIVRIPQLTPKGCEHLSADLNYIVNVFSALGLKGHPHPLINHLAALVMLDGEIFKERIANWDRTDPVQAALMCIEQRIALMRGIHS